MHRFAVIGLGQFGSAIARVLAQRGAEVLAIDNREESVNYIREDVAYAVTMEATDIRALRGQNVQEMDAVVVAIGENFDGLLLTTVLLMEMNCKRIIARAMNRHQRMILEKVGVTEILSPEDEVSVAVAEKLINPSVVSSLQLPDEYEIVEVKTPPKIANRTLIDLSLRKKYNLNLITVKREFDVTKNGETVKEIHILGVPRSDTVLFDTDTMLIMGKTRDIERFIEINQ
ncbi:MAG: TrkA family potassium uptake protein [Bacteroidia bacterium]|nr:TrkA family potassium uptake protein [Bacteroidia bacterium]